MPSNMMMEENWTRKDWIAIVVMYAFIAGAVITGILNSPTWCAVCLILAFLIATVMMARHGLWI